MGLDIYFYKTKSNEKDIEKVYMSDKETAKGAFSKAYDKVINALCKVSADKYAEAYTKRVKGLFKYCNYPQYDLSKLGVGFDYRTCKYTQEVKSVSEMALVKDDIVKEIETTYVAYFRKVNFIYEFFRNDIDDKESAWASKEEIEHLVRNCEKVLKNPNLAERLLPTCSGCFFGSTDYDNWYLEGVKDCLKQMKKLLRGFKDDERVYIVFSW